MNKNNHPRQNLSYAKIIKIGISLDITEYEALKEAKANTQLTFRELLMQSVWEILDPQEGEGNATA